MKYLMIVVMAFFVGMTTAEAQERNKSIVCSYNMNEWLSLNLRITQQENQGVDYNIDSLQEQADALWWRMERGGCFDICTE